MARYILIVNVKVWKLLSKTQQLLSRLTAEPRLPISLSRITKPASM